MDHQRSSTRPITQQSQGVRSNGQQPLPTMQPSQTKQNTRTGFAAIWKWTGIAKKKGWDWLQLLLLPLLLTAGGIWFQAQQHDSDQAIAKANREKDIQIASDQQQAATLKSYLDDMTDLILNKALQQSKPDDEVRVVARAKTLTALRGLNGDRKGVVIQFLYEADLIGALHSQYNNPSRTDAVVNLEGSDLSHANLFGATLWWVNLSMVNLSNANLGMAELEGANLQEADLEGADLRRADMVGVDLSGSDLTGDHLDATNLLSANLVEANLKNATITKDQLALTKSLQNATLPDGSKYPSQSYPIPNHQEP